MTTATRRNRNSEIEILEPCQDCGRTRWVRLVHGEPRSKLCLSCALKGKHLSEGTKLKLSRLNTGKKASVETRQRMSQSHKALKKRKSRKVRNGYITVYSPSHPNADSHGNVFEHRLVMEAAIGRFLEPEEAVHHRGTKYPMGSLEDKQDNRRENLRLFKTHGQHSKYHKERDRLSCPSSGK